MGRADPWSPSYTANAFYDGFAKGRSASLEFVRGAESLAARVEGAKPPAFMLAGRNAQVVTWGDSNISGAFIMGEAKQCAFPGCSVRLVGNWNRLYCPEHSPFKR